VTKALASFLKPHTVRNSQTKKGHSVNQVALFICC
jgi:hypothetical protein